MFKKTIAALLAIAIVISFVGCEGVKKDSVPKRKYDKTDPSAVLEEITNDFNAVALYITEELEKTYSDVGTTFEAYQKNKGQIDEWIELVLSESDALLQEQKRTLLFTSSSLPQIPNMKTMISVMMPWMHIMM